MKLLTLELRAAAWLMLGWLAFVLAMESIELRGAPFVAIAGVRSAWRRWRRRRVISSGALA